MHIKRLAENLVQKALLLFEIYKPYQFWIFVLVLYHTLNNV
jgi:hypothetical protein